MSYSQDEIKEFFYHQMNETELQKMNELDADDMLLALRNGTYTIKYIDNVGYIFIGKGYYIYMDGSQEEQYLIHNLFTNATDARKEIEKDYKNKR